MNLIFLSLSNNFIYYRNNLVIREYLSIKIRVNFTLAVPSAAILMSLHDQYMLRDHTAPIFTDTIVSFRPPCTLVKIGTEVNRKGMNVNRKLNLRMSVISGYILWISNRFPQFKMGLVISPIKAITIHSLVYLP